MTKSTTARLSISLPRDMDKRVRAFAKDADASVSAIVKAALACFMQPTTTWAAAKNGGSSAYFTFQRPMGFAPKAKRRGK